ncbi:hypothetical protein [Methylobacterium sp. A54F]
MNLWLALRRLLPLLAVLSLALTPVTAPAATAGMHASMARAHHAMAGIDHAAMSHHDAMSHHAAGSTVAAGPDMDDMPCCPKTGAGARENPESDCAKGCPLMALCLASLTSLPPAALRVPTPVATRAGLTWPEPAFRAGVHGSPSPEPPRA